MDKYARESAEYLNGAIMYQIFLRAFCAEGTLKGAKKMLPHLADIGVDIIYLCPIAKADDDENREFWSERQLKSGMDNPCNPYRIADYYSIDPEYGDEDDLFEFVRAAHKLEMKVILDLVYFHCGPKAVFLEEHPDFIVRGEDGKPVNGQWRFPRLNFENPALREYLWQNMEFFVDEYGVDGYRCDVGDGVPLDFWETGRERLEELDPDIIMLNEGTKPEALLKAFDLNYDFGWHDTLAKVLAGEKPASELVELYEKEADRLPVGGKLIRSIDNHDVANESYDVRLQTKLGSRAIEAAHVLNYTIDGVAFVYNGYEVCDTARHSIWANRQHSKNCVIDWSNALTDEGRERITFLKNLADMRHSSQAICVGATSMIENDCPEQVISFQRSAIFTDDDDETDEEVEDDFREEPFQPGDEDDHHCHCDDCDDCDDEDCCGEETDDIAVIINLSNKPLTCHIECDCGVDHVLASKGTYCAFNGETLTLDMLPYGFYVAQL